MIWRYKSALLILAAASVFYAYVVLSNNAVCDPNLDEALKGLAILIALAASIIAISNTAGWPIRLGTVEKPCSRACPS